MVDKFTAVKYGIMAQLVETIGNARGQVAGAELAGDLSQQEADDLRLMLKSAMDAIMLPPIIVAASILREYEATSGK